MTKILKDIRVVEMGTFITGPAAAMYMADQGADVIKVERPETGDPFRAFKGGLYSPHFQTYNRNKRSIALDTRQPEDQAVLHERQMCSSRISGPVWQKSLVPARKLCGPSIPG
jgi:crotonobetainyl-CoA:carnitine CoA-transferase CaiB-like acyl-CoA transferase